MEQNIIHINSEKETEAFGRELGANATVGTGKTTLTKYIAAGLGVTEPVTSPTFNIIKEYRSGRLPLFHFDVYRIGDVDEMFEIGYEEYFYGDGVCVIEWADLIEEIIPEDALTIRITSGVGEEERIYEITDNRKA